MAKKYNIPEEIKPGVKFRWNNHELWHIVGTLPDGGETVVVIKSWSRLRNYWVYDVVMKETLLDWWELQRGKAIKMKGDIISDKEFTTKEGIKVRLVAMKNTNLPVINKAVGEGNTHKGRD